MSESLSMVSVNKESTFTKKDTANKEGAHGSIPLLDIIPSNSKAELIPPYRASCGGLLTLGDLL